MRRTTHWPPKPPAGCGFGAGAWPRLCGPDRVGGPGSGTPAGASGGGWLYTGDLGSLDEEGYLTLRGRSDDLIVRGGVNIYPEVVEQALCRCPAVADAAVVGRPVSGAETEIWAFLLPNPTAHPPLTEALLFAHCRSVLPAWMHPTRVRLVESLPRTTSGKVKEKGCSV